MSSPPISNLDDVPGNLGCLVEVKAQVMTRDNILGMWGPLFGGGMSIVRLYRNISQTSDGGSLSQTHYVIKGLRLSDSAVILTCAVSPGFQYTKVNPTFHHWAVDDKRFGLTFQTFADATAFEKTIASVVESMRNSGSADVCPTVADGALPKNLKTINQDIRTGVDLEEKPCLPQKMHLKPAVVPDRPSTHCMSGPVSFTIDRSSSASAPENCSSGAWTDYSADVSSATLSPLARAGVSIPQRGVIIGAESKFNGEPVYCPERPARLRGPDLPKAFAERIYEDARPSKTLESTVIPVPPCPMTPKVVVRSGLDKKRAQTPPPPVVPLKSAIVNSMMPNVYVKSKNVDQSLGIVTTAVPVSRGTVDAKRDDISDDLSRKLMMVPRSVSPIDKDSTVYFASSYVHFLKGGETGLREENEYLYPNFESVGSATSRQPAGMYGAYEDYRHSSRIASHLQVPPLPSKQNRKPPRKSDDSGKKCDLYRTDSANFKSKCIHCNEYFSPKENRNGACADGPDGFRDCVKSGNCCAQAVLYHCGDDEDGDATDLWTCGVCDRRSCRQWTVLTLVCLFLPCMWCFLPLRSCHRCGVACGCCGARHQAGARLAPKV